MPKFAAATSSFIPWFLRLYLPVMLTVSTAYGVLAYLYFAALSAATPGKSGLMQLSFLVGVPMCMGALVNFLIRRQRKFNFLQAAGLTGLPILLAVLLSYALLNEGTVCIIMALPFILVIAAIGFLIVKVASLAAFGKAKNPNKLMSVLLVTPFLSGVVEERVESPVFTTTIERSILIHAKSEKIWQQINNPLNIQPTELAQGVAFRIGVPYPVEARTLEGKIGGRRKGKWERGISFEEEFTAWEPNRHLTWKYIFGPDSFPKGSLDDHIVIGGRYFGLEDTSYTLVPTADGSTYLKIEVKVRISTNFNWYAAAWAKYLVGNTAETILNFYRQRAEAGDV